MVIAILAGHAWLVQQAGNGEEALRLVSGGNAGVDLLITDLVLPGMSGLELASQLRGLHPAVGVLCMSGHALPSTPQNGVQFIEKPFRPDVLLNQVKQLLGCL